MTTDPAESILGPITPIRCNLIGCHWSCHGVPDKYTDSRARIIREHMAAEHAPKAAPVPAAVWTDGDPLHEAIAAAVYERCGTDPVSSIVVDDPRNIAAVAATVARQVLGTVTAPPETDPVGLCAACGDPREGHHHGYERTPGYDEAQQPTPRRRCAHTDVLYGRCVRYLDNHDGDCWHEEQQPAPAVTEEAK